MPTVTLNSGSLPMWEANINEMELWQPELAAKLRAWVDINGHHFEHDEMTTPAGIWISGLTSEPFFQPSKHRPWGEEKVEKNVSVVFVYGTGMASWLADIIRSVPDETSDIVVLEPNIALLAYL